MSKRKPSVELSRREFFPVAAGAAAVAAGAGEAADAPKLPRLKKAVKYDMVGVKGTPKEKFALLKKLGFLGVEINSPSGLNLDDLVAARDATGVVIHGVIDSVHWNKPLSHPKESVRAEGLAALRTALQDAKKVGADTVLLVPGVVNKEVSYQQCWERSHGRGQEGPGRRREGPREDRHRSGVEQLPHQAGAARRVRRSVQERVVGAYFDCSNMIKYGVPPATWIRKLGKRMLKFDFKGYSVAKAKEAKNVWKGFAVGIGEGRRGLAGDPQGVRGSRLQQLGDGRGRRPVTRSGLRTSRRGWTRSSR